ncbi:hypothetical protein KIM67_02795 [Flagellimonas sp. 389]|uniref:hypothetical protein n=1 Tax=Flagellimonas sp. 389 TaxID=2835862 RepID=UPI001BD40147|nr:hypothetical protein [Flagellimonas sp. 389]MBS9461323.1 hypothetical protein [Flagellimonas sp. 389]
MIENLPNWINISFFLVTLITIGIFYISNGRPKKLLLLILLWSAIQSIIAFTGFYQITDTTPPRFALVLLPSALSILFGMSSKNLKWMFATRKIEVSTFLHCIRIPVEFILLYLFLNKTIPKTMTFEGLNFDIIAGITAPLVGLLYIKGKLGKKGLLIWNVLGLILIFTILTIGILSSELPFQQFGFEQPNRAIDYFPFILLPATVVPMVIYTHLTDIIKLRKEIEPNFRKWM